MTASLLALHSPQDENILVINPYYPSEAARRIKSALTSTEIPFSEIIILDSGPISQPGWSRDGFGSVGDTYELTKLIDELLPSRLYVFSDKKLLETTALHKVSEEHPDTECIYVEDGIIAYVNLLESQNCRNETKQSSMINRVIKKANDTDRNGLYRFLHRYLTGIPRATHSQIQQLIIRGLFGHWWNGRPDRLPGLSQYIDQINVFYPELVHPSLTDLEVRELPKVYLQSDELDSFAILYFDQINGNILDQTAQIDMIISLPRVRTLSNTSLEKELTEVYNFYSDKGYTVAFKPHPRDGDISQTKLPDSIVLPSDIPMELFYLLLRDQLKCVAGAMSTSLPTAQLICNDVDVICIGIDSTHPNLSDREISKFRSMGVDFELKLV